MKSYLIVGASSGIGHRLAQRLKDEGNQVLGTYCSKDSADLDDGITYHHLDVMNDDLDFSWLPDNLDGLVYCPGSITLKPFHRIKVEDFVNDFQLQVAGAIKSIQAALPALKKGSDPSIVLISTVAVQRGFTFHSQVSTSKGALEGLCRALAAEFAPKIRVNCIAPSLTDTPLAAKLLNSEQKIEANAQRHPLKRIGKTEDIAAAASFLLSSDATWMSGEVLHVDGGMANLRV